MAKQFQSIEASHREFIERQHVFFTGSATASGHVNVSPKGLNAFRVLGPKRVAYLDLTGSGNETAAHLRADGRLTVMFCAFDGAPLILRLYGRGRIVPSKGPEYAEMLAVEFGGDETPGARQIVILDVDLVQTSCGFGVPLFDYAAERPTLVKWAETKGAAGLDAYRREKNAHSIDGFSTGLLEDDQST